MMDFLAALAIDILVGDPHWFPHPVRLMGNIISLEERAARKAAKNGRMLKLFGAVIVAVNIALAFSVPYIILQGLRGNQILYHIVNTYLLYTCFASGCLRDEGIKIYRALSLGIDDARHKLSYIVGRDTANLDEKEIIRATVETIAENTSDGVIAPMIFAIIGGAPLAFTYKMVNTMDSMLGYMNDKYRDIGFFPAKTDDVLNFIPARITGVLMCASSVFRFNALEGFRVMIRDRKNHKSPNCAYPEGAMAGLLGVQLGGDNFYLGEVMKKPKIGDRINELGKEDIKKAIEIMHRPQILLTLIYFATIGGII
jgi:adenosylcobinamide-phosphate synthase